VQNSAVNQDKPELSLCMYVTGFHINMSNELLSDMALIKLCSGNSVS